MFHKYQHIERLKTDETDGIDMGVCYIFPKLDGSNASVWLEDTDDGYYLKGGSRNRELSLDKDNAGFLEFITETRIKHDLTALLLDHPSWRIFGEWLVPHTLKTYREEAWRKFYVFDVYDDELCKYLPYDIYQPIMEEFGIDYIPPLCTMNDPTLEQLEWEMQKNTYLVQDGMGSGEGLVIKNYDYKNKWGRTTWAKLVRNEFKERNAEAFGVRKVDGKKLIEKEIAEAYVTEAFVAKTRAKIEEDLRSGGGPAERKRLIPRLLETCFHEIVVEETWNIVKKYKNPTISFGKLKAHVIHLVKLRASDLF